MSRNGYTLLGALVWRGGKWYLRKRLPSRRTVAVTGLGAVAAVAATVLLARRLAG